MGTAFRPGLELARDFHDETVAPLLRPALAGTPYAAALLGPGSEVQGFDTPRSTDHAWGPRLQVFLTPDAHRAHAAGLTALLDRELPKRFHGHPVRFAFPGGTPPRHWVDVLDVTAHFAEQLGEVPDGGLSVGGWLAAPWQVLRELTGGAVFHDGAGVLTSYREGLRRYPDQVWRYVLACQWQRLHQEEPFTGRCGEVGDDLGSAVTAARQVRELMRLWLLMHRVHPPYGKWLGTAFAAVPGAAELAPLLSGALAAGDWRERERCLSHAYELVARTHNGLGLTAPLRAEVRPFHERPFLVLGADRFRAALLATVDDPRLAELPPVGSVDQYTDSTDLTAHGFADRRRRYLARLGGTVT